MEEEIRQMESMSAERSKVDLQKNQKQLERLLIHIEEMELEYNHCMQTETNAEKRKRFASQRPFELERFARTKRILERLIQMDIEALAKYASRGSL